MAVFPGFELGMGLGGWLTNYKRFNVLPDAWRGPLSPGDFEHFASYISEDDVRNIASFGVDHLRLGFDQIVLEERPGHYREQCFAHIDAFIGWCERAGLNVVLNLHKAVGNYCDIQEPVQLLDDQGLQDRFIALWLEFERRYHHKPAVAFELLNEVRDVPPEQWNELAGRAVAALRAVNPTRKIIIGSTRWNSPDTLKELRLYDDDAIIYTFHNYAPFAFTHQQGVLQAGPLYYNRKMAYPSDIEPYRDFERFVNANEHAYAGVERMDKAWLRASLQPAFDFVAANPDKILWCGEFGTIRHCRLEYRENWMSDMISLLKEHRISYCVWNYLSTPSDGNRFSLVDDERRQILSPRLLEIIQGKVP
jgi:endoglucanase